MRGTGVRNERWVCTLPGMTPARGDHDARRTEVSQAVWRVLAARGFGGLTLRAVATEMGATTGLLTHYFPSKRALVRHALDVLDRRSADRPRPATERAGAASGLVMLRARLLDILPLDAESAASNRIWVGSWDVALADPELADEHAARYRQGRERMTEHIAEAQSLGELPQAPPLGGCGGGGPELRARPGGPGAVRTGGVPGRAADRAGGRVPGGAEGGLRGAIPRRTA